jgi:hypothetical protein
MSMFKSIFGVATATVLIAGGVFMPGYAEAVPLGPADLAKVAGDLQLSEKAQYVFRGKQHCWYDDGWRGSGWYWCGYNTRRGLGWGGAQGWRGWNRESSGREVRGRDFDRGREGRGRDFDRGREDRGRDFDRRREDRGRDFNRGDRQRDGEGRRSEGRRGEDFRR